MKPQSKGWTPERRAKQVRSLGKSQVTTKGWTPQRRAKQAQKIHDWQPWQHSTGAKTAEGKARSSQNANKGKGALMAQIKELRRELMAEIEESNTVIMTARKMGE